MSWANYRNVLAIKRSKICPELTSPLTLVPPLLCSGLASRVSRGEGSRDAHPPSLTPPRPTNDAILGTSCDHATALWCPPWPPPSGTRSRFRLTRVTCHLSFLQYPAHPLTETFLFLALPHWLHYSGWVDDESTLTNCSFGLKPTATREGYTKRRMDNEMPAST